MNSNLRAENTLGADADDRRGNVSGTKLINELAAASGLPTDLIGQELSRLIVDAGKDTSEITLDELRDLLAQYLQEVLIAAKNSLTED